MGVDCCGKSRSGAFCPACGRKLGDDPLRDLLEFCRKIEKGAEKLAAKHERWAVDDDSPVLASKIEVLRRGEVMWKARGDALAALMGGVDDTTSSGETRP